MWVFVKDIEKMNLTELEKAVIELNEKLSNQEEIDHDYAVGIMKRYEMSISNNISEIGEMIDEQEKKIAATKKTLRNQKKLQKSYLKIKDELYIKNVLIGSIKEKSNMPHYEIEK